MLFTDRFLLGGGVMKPGENYEVVIKKRRSRLIPKKILRHTKIPVNKKYTFNVSVWIADTPQSNLKPTINLTLSHNGVVLRLCFPEIHDLWTAVHDLRAIVDDISPLLHERHTAAVKEFLDHHASAMHLPTNDYTVYTVIQDIQGGNGLKTKLRVNSATGEVLGEQ
jgi:hypothetical protein